MVYSKGVSKEFAPLSKKSNLILSTTMSLPYIKSVRSIAFDTVFTGAKKNTRQGLTPFTSRLAQVTKRDIGSPMMTSAERLERNKITYLRKKGRGYHAVGVGEMAGNFAEVKTELKSRGYTGVRFIGRILAL